MDIESVCADDITELPPVVSVTAYRTVQEVIANAAKHAPVIPGQSTY